jgi:hypothetical protein
MFVVIAGAFLVGCAACGAQQCGKYRDRGRVFYPLGQSLP